MAMKAYATFSKVPVTTAENVSLTNISSTQVMISLKPSLPGSAHISTSYKS